MLTVSTVVWSFYLGSYIRGVYANKSLLLDSQIDLMAVSGLSIFILIFGSISLVISYRTLVTGDLTKTQLGILLISAIAFSSIFNIAVSLM